MEKAIFDSVSYSIFSSVVVGNVIESVGLTPFWGSQDAMSPMALGHAEVRCSPGLPTRLKASLTQEVAQIPA